MKNKLALFSLQNNFSIIVLWVVFQIVWYMCFGVEFDLEATKYIGEAAYIVEHHHLSQFRYLFYFTTIAVIAFANAIHIGNYGSLFIIMAINLAGYLIFFKALKQLFSNKHMPFFIVAFLITFWPYQSWSLFLFTECLFYSLVMILFSHLILYRALTFRFLAIVCVLLFLLIISRPLGILLVLPTLLFIFFKLSRKQKIYVVIAAVLFLVLLNFIIQIVFTTTPDWNMTRALTEDSIICDMPRAHQTNLDLSHSSNQFYQLFYYVAHNFSHFMQLALIRLKYFFALVRDYYSFSHNAYLVAYLVVLYGTIVFGIKKIVRSLSTSLNIFLLSSILIFAMTVALQCDDYHNRFFLTLMPFLVVMAAIVWQPLVDGFTFFSRRGKD